MAIERVVERKLCVYLFHKEQNKLFPSGEFKYERFDQVLKSDPLYIINLDEISKIDEVKTIIKEKADVIDFFFIGDNESKEVITDFENILKQTKDSFGMYFHSDPENIEAFIKDIEQVRTHFQAINEIERFLDTSNFYTATLNRIDYGISIINEKYQILYTNRMRRFFHGDNIIGKRCFEVFPYDSDSRKDSCHNCQMHDKIFAENSTDKYRCEVHKVSASMQNHNVYFASEAVSLLTLTTTDKKLVKLGVNVVKDNTPRILFQEFTKLIQRAKEFDTIIEILKFALLGGLKQDFEEILRKEFEGDKEIFEQVLSRITFTDKEGDEKILNYKLGRFRLYRNHNDTFKETEGDILQIYKSFKIDDNYNSAEEEDLKWKYFDCSQTILFGNELKFSETGELSRSFTDYVKEIPEDNKAILIEHLKEVKLLEKTDADIKIDKHIWYDVKLVFDGELFGYISFDWKGREGVIKKGSITNEHLSYLKMLIDFAAQSIHSFITHKTKTTLAELNRIIGQDYIHECEMKFDFGKELCTALKVLRFEVFSIEKKEILRNFVYYNDLDSEKNKTLYNEVRDINRYDKTKGLIGAALNKINEYKEIFKEWIPVNILSYELFDKYFENEKEKQIRKDFLILENQLLPEGYKYKNKTIQNCIIAPLVLRDRLIGVIKLSNNLYDGKAFFPVNNGTILLEVANQLAIRMEIFRVLERAKNIDNIFSKMSELFNKIEKSNNENISTLDAKLETVYRKIVNSIAEPYIDISKADLLIHYLITKDNMKDSYSIRNVYPFPLLNDSLTIEFEKNILLISNKNSQEPFYNFDLSKNENDNQLFYDNKILIKLSNINNDFLSLMILQNEEGLEKEIQNSLESINNQLCAILKLHIWIRKTDEVRDNILHQVISPLTGLKQICDNLLNSELDENHKDYFGGYRNNPSKKRFDLDLVRSQTAQVRAMAARNKEYNDFELGKSSKYSPTTFNFMQYLIRIASTYQTFAKLQNIQHISVKNESSTDNENLNIDGDKTILDHIFSSLIDNAIKYTDRMSPNNDITISVDYDLGTFTIAVNNFSKIDIPQNEKDNIFKRNVRLPEAKKMNPHGSGIGLYMVKGFCEKIGGDCYLLLSNQTKGTTFIVKLPNTFKRKG